MCSSISPSETRNILLNLREYVSLLQANRSFSDKGEEPPSEIQSKLEQAKKKLPDHVRGYVSLLISESPHQLEKAITTLTEKGCCARCKQTAHPEWRKSISQGKVIFICGRCRAIFVPASPPKEVYV